MAELTPGDFRRVINGLNGEELRQVVLYFKLGAIAFAESQGGATVGREVIGAMDDKELNTAALLMFLGAVALYCPIDRRARALKIGGVDLLEEIRREMEG